MALDHFECTVIGGGIVGLAVAKELSASKNTVLLESSNNIMSETSSRNSEVVHSGIYYPFNSKKRQACIEGKKRIYEYCKTKNIPHKKKFSEVKKEISRKLFANPLYMVFQ